MNTNQMIGDVTRYRTGVCPAPSATSTIRRSGLLAGARHAAVAGIAASVAGAAFAEHSQKRTDMALIDTTGWPLGPQDRPSG